MLKPLPVVNTCSYNTATLQERFGWHGRASVTVHGPQHHAVRKAHGRAITATTGHVDRRSATAGATRGGGSTTATAVVPAAPCLTSAATADGSMRPGFQEQHCVAIAPHNHLAERGAQIVLKAGHNAIVAPLDVARSSPRGGFKSRARVWVRLGLHARRAKAVPGQSCAVTAHMRCTAAAARAATAATAASPSAATAATTTIRHAAAAALQRWAMSRLHRWVKVRGEATEPGVGDDLRREPQPRGLSTHTALERWALVRGHAARPHLQRVANQCQQQRVCLLHHEHASLSPTDIATLARLQELRCHVGIRDPRARAKAHTAKAVERLPPAGCAFPHSQHGAAQAGGALARLPARERQCCVPRSRLCSGSQRSARPAATPGPAHGSGHL
jgi:hypothetical protein